MELSSKASKSKDEIPKLGTSFGWCSFMLFRTGKVLMTAEIPADCTARLHQTLHCLQSGSGCWPDQHAVCLYQGQSQFLWLGCADGFLRSISGPSEAADMLMRARKKGLHTSYVSHVCVISTRFFFLSIVHASQFCCNFFFWKCWKFYPTYISAWTFHWESRVDVPLGTEGWMFHYWEPRGGRSNGNRGGRIKSYCLVFFLFMSPHLTKKMEFTFMFWCLLVFKYLNLPLCLWTLFCCYFLKFQKDMFIHFHSFSLSHELCLFYAFFFIK